MSNNTDIRPRYSVVTSILAIALSVIFLLTSCSTFIAERKASQQEALAAAVPVESSAPAVTQIAQDAGHTPAVDQAMDDWERARAAYLRSLDYAEIEQQPNGRDEYLVKSNLIESRYHIKSSETAMYVEHDFRKALGELRVAEQRFTEAIDKANSDESSAMSDAKSGVDVLLKQAQLSLEHGVIVPQLEHYHKVEENIEDLVADL